MNIILTILKTVPLFQSLTEEEHEAIIEHITEQFYPANYSLFNKGDQGDAMYIIKSGMVKIFDADQTIAELGDDMFFGEMALIEDAPRMASAQTLSDCEIFLLKKEDFAALMQKSPEIAQKVKEAYEGRKAVNDVNLP